MKMAPVEDCLHQLCERSDGGWRSDPVLTWVRAVQPQLSQRISSRTMRRRSLSLLTESARRR